MATKKKTDAAPVKAAVIDAKVVEKKAAGAMDAVKGIVIRNDEAMTEASKMLTGIKQAQRWVKQEKSKQLDPAQETVRSIKAFWLPFEERFAEAERVLKGKIEAFTLAAMKRAEKKEEGISEKVNSGEMSFEDGVKKQSEITAPKTTARVEGGTVSVTMRKQATIVNPELIPDRFWIIDEVAVRRAALAGEVIPGVEVKEVPVTAIR